MEVNSDNGEIMTDLYEEKLLAQLKNVKLESGGKGVLSLTSKRIEFEKKSGLFSSSHLEFSVDLPRLFTSKVNSASNTLVLEWMDENGDLVGSRLTLPKGDATTNLSRSLNKTLKLLRNEAELKERRVYYQAFLWKAAYHVWIIAGLLSQIVRELTHESWDAVDASLIEASEMVNTLAVEGAIDAVAPVQALIDRVPSRDATLVLPKAIAAIGAIGTSLHSELPIAKEWEELALEHSPGLNWRDIRYIFLFAGRYNLLSLWQQFGETEKIETSLPRLAKLAAVLSEKGIMQSQHGNSLGETEASSIAETVDAAAQNLEGSLKMNAGVA